MDYKNLTDEELLDLIDKSFFNYQKFKDKGEIDNPILADIRAQKPKTGNLRSFKIM